MCCQMEIIRAYERRVLKNIVQNVRRSAIAVREDDLPISPWISREVSHVSIKCVVADRTRQGPRNLDRACCSNKDVVLQASIKWVHRADPALTVHNSVIYEHGLSSAWVAAYGHEKCGSKKVFENVANDHRTHIAVSKRTGSVAEPPSERIHHTAVSRVEKNAVLYEGYEMTIIFASTV